ncbi:MAG TPA: NYN domain-containing protein, partial [Candidatus Gracilibacteria bacterium]|nr:NYN domain-containing protein [Candidatus Gracilibacteria bacterium]
MTVTPFHATQRVGVFIDTQNLYHSARSLFHANVNYRTLVETAVHGRRLIRAFAYVIKSDTSEESKFFEALQDLGIETRVKDLQIFFSGEKKADWDVGIAIDIVRLS